MDTRYQVFVSSTYADLRDERQRVFQALMEMDCIPAGMELFPAADEEQFKFIMRIIDDCDYYLLIIGGRYGSTTVEGVSYTEKEYDYAVSRGLPVIAFLHESPDEIPLGKSEQNPELRERLQAFRNKVATGRLVRSWKTAEELPGLVALSLQKTIKTYRRVGWVRADRVPDEAAAQEILRLRNEVAALTGALDQLSTTPPPHTGNLAQGEESISLVFRADVQGLLRNSESRELSRPFTWNQLLSVLGPILLNEASETAMIDHLEEIIRHKVKDELAAEVYRVSLRREDFQQVKVQLLALGLIMKGEHDYYWTLTPYGVNKMTQVVAIQSSKQSKPAST